MYYNKNSVYTHKVVFFSQGKKQAFTHIARFARSSTIINQQLSIYNKISVLQHWQHKGHSQSKKK